jgi:hypothetical protein
MLDWLDPGKWVAGLVLGLANLFGTTQASIVKQIIQLLFMAALPTVEKLQKGWFALGIGATYGLAAQVMGLVAVTIALIVLITPLKNHGMKLGRGLSSFAMVLIFGVMFYPVYGLLYSLSQALTQGVLNIATSSPTGDSATLIAAVNAVLPEDPFTRMITNGLSLFFGCWTFIEAIALQIALLLILVFYPLVLALRPVVGLARGLLNLFNSGIITVLVSPPVMGIGFALPVLVKDYIPGGSLAFVPAILTVIGGIFAAVTPTILAVLSFRGSKEIFGTVDATLAGKLDINSLPPVTMDDVNKDIKDTQHSPLKSITEAVQTADLLDDDLFSDMKKTTVKLGMFAATATGHPEAAAFIGAVDNFTKPNKPKDPSDN